MVVIMGVTASLASIMVTTMWGVAVSTEASPDSGPSVVTCSGGWTVVNRPALVRWVVIITSAGYSVKNGAAVVDTSVQRWWVEAVVSITSSGGSVAKVGRGTGTGGVVVSVG